jgi:hypothetical protein
MMTSPAETITVTCPGCRKSYEDWWRPSINLSLGEKFDDEYLDRASSATCKYCGLKVYLKNLIVQEDGTWVTHVAE